MPVTTNVAMSTQAQVSALLGGGGKREGPERLQTGERSSQALPQNGLATQEGNYKGGELGARAL